MENNGKSAQAVQLPSSSSFVFYPCFLLLRDVRIILVEASKSAVIFTLVRSHDLCDVFLTYTGRTRGVLVLNCESDTS